MAIGIALFVTVLWSSSWVLIRWGLDGEGLPPLTFAALRYAMASVFVIGWVLSREREAANPKTMGRGTILGLAGLGVVMYTLTQGAQFVAIDNQPAATTSLVLSLTPLLVAGLSVVSLHETPTIRQLAGTVLVVVGAWLYFAGDLGATAIGMIAAGVGLASNVGAALLGRHINRKELLPPAVITGYSMAVGSALLIAIGLAVEGVPSISGKAWAIIAWLALVNTALAFTLWNLSLQRLSAVESASINNTMLVQIAILAWIFLSEPLGTPELIGIGLVTVGVVLTQRLNNARP
jgi:drug/metabolite transporter (DMT)-like permease